VIVGAVVSPLPLGVGWVPTWMKPDREIVVRPDPATLRLIEL
jgi:hypothetical protein